MNFRNLFKKKTSQDLARELAYLMKKEGRRSMFLEIEPMQVAGFLETTELCDNSRRITDCNNVAKVCVSAVTIEVKLNEEGDHYHVCNSCAAIAIRKNDTEPFE